MWRLITGLCEDLVPYEVNQHGEKQSTAEPVELNSFLYFKDPQNNSSLACAKTLSLLFWFLTEFIYMGLSSILNYAPRWLSLSLSWTNHRPFNTSSINEVKVVELWPSTVLKLLSSCKPRKNVPERPYKDLFPGLSADRIVKCTGTYRRKFKGPVL